MLVINDVGIENFPKDDIRRVIWWYGPVVKNPYDSKNPLVLLIARALIDNKLSKNIEILRVPLPELDQVRLGSIWKGSKKTKQIWTDFPGYQSNRLFSFDFTMHVPESIQFLAKKPNSQFGYIPPFIYNLGNFDDDPELKILKQHFFKTHLTKLISENGTTVLIPALEFLSGAIAPEHKEIRAGLLNNNLDTLLLQFVKNAYSQDDEYNIEYIEQKTEANRNILAYLSLNQVSRSRISSLWHSMQMTEINRYTGTAYLEKYPQVLPYHPEQLSLKGDGIWIDKNTFLMLRIMGLSLPVEHQIYNLRTCLLDDPPSDDNNEDDDKPNKPNDSSNSNYDNNDEYEATELNDSDNQAGAVYIRSEVKIIGNRRMILDKTDYRPSGKPTITPPNPDKDSEISDPIPNDTEGNKDSDETEEDEDNTHTVSSGESNDRAESKDTKSIKQAELAEDRPNNHLTKIIKSLETLSHSVKSNISSFVFIDNEGHEHFVPAFCRITRKQLPKDHKGRWHTIRKKEKTKCEYILRNFLIVKIILNDGTSAYLLEIARKKSESYLGLIFNIDSGVITKSIIKDLLKTIVGYKGRYTKQSEQEASASPNKKLPLIKHELPVQHSLLYKHSSDDKLMKTIEKALNNKIFI